MNTQQNTRGMPAYLFFRPMEWTARSPNGKKVVSVSKSNCSILPFDLTDFYDLHVASILCVAQRELRLNVVDQLVAPLSKAVWVSDQSIP